MGKIWEKTKAIWALIGNIWLAKDLAIWVGLPTLGAAMIGPLAVHLFTPLSFTDTAITAVIFGFIGFILAVRFAPKVRHASDLTVHGALTVRGRLTVEGTPSPATQIPLHEAAVRLHEAEEQEGLQEMPLPSSLSPADAILEHCKYVFLTAAREERIVLWGTRPPSRNSTKIQTQEIAQYSPAPGSSRLNPSFATGAGIVDVWIYEADLQNEIKYRIDLLKKLSGPI